MDEMNKGMLTFPVVLRTPTDVKEFCFVASEMPRNSSITANHDVYTVDARSILGMFSLDLTQTILVKIDNMYGTENWIEKFDRWRVD